MPFIGPKNSLLIAVLILGLCAINQVIAQTTPLDSWEVSIDNGQTFHSISVPRSIEDCIDPNFDGVSIYRTELPVLDLTEDQRVWIHFGAVATHAIVRINDQQVGEHLGGWTPFSVEITSLVRHQSRPQVLTVIVDERIGHNTQGFLPIITNHFGGIWQPVQMQVTGSAALLSNWSNAVVNTPELAINCRLTVNLPVSQHKDGDSVTFKIAIAPLPLKSFGTRLESLDWRTADCTVDRQTLSVHSAPYYGESNCENVCYTANFISPLTLEPWSVTTPQLYALRVELWQADQLRDTHYLRFGRRSFQTHQDKFLLNGQPISIRGVLNWGYSPPRIAPALDVEWMKKEILFAQQRGFNLMKFCLWIPPQQYLELCDQLGMLAWIEYPTWHPKLDQQHLEDLRREYSEFFAFDRNHPSVVLRSLTCETGPSAELSVVQSLYDQCKEMVPDAVVEDDSSWISWNRIHDFYDDHPYGNNHQWVQSLTKLREHIAHGQLQPLALGEAIAADSWLEPTESLLRQAATDVAHGSWGVADNARWQSRIQKLADDNQRVFRSNWLRPQSLHYGMLMRKFQIETYRREVPHGAYVVSVIRDFPKASMGLIDFNGNAKSTPDQWSFQRDKVLVLSCLNDHRSFVAESNQAFTIHLAGAVNSDLPANLSLSLEKTSLNRGDKNKVVWSSEKTITDLESCSVTFDVPLPPATELGPQRLVLKTRCWTKTKANTDNSEELASNQWPIWLFPPVTLPAVSIHDSAIQLASDLGLNRTSSASSETLVLARSLDKELLERVEQGGRVLLIPDGQPGSFPLEDLWFLRGSLAVLPKDDESWHLPFKLASIDGSASEPTSNQNMLIELQHFDLAGSVVPRIDGFLELVDPLLLFWDNHDLRETRTHGLVFGLNVGAGRVLVSTLKHHGQNNAAGKWLLKQWLEQLQQTVPQSPYPRRLALTTMLRTQLDRRQLSLAGQPWRFQPDPQHLGHDQNWYATDFHDQNWNKVRIDKHWEGQGYAALDHWAWYRTKVALPAELQHGKLYLNLNGIDDYADIYVNGQWLASVGDIDKKETAFEIRKSIDISRWSDSDSLQIAIGVYDWFGAGGIFRPISLTNSPQADTPRILVGPTE